MVDQSGRLSSFDLLDAQSYAAHRRKTPTIGVRIGKDEKKRFAAAATAKGMTLSGFIRDAARAEAHRVLGLPKSE